MVNDRESQEACEVYAAPPVIPQQAGDGRRQEEAKNERERKEPPVLPIRNPVLFKVDCISRARPNAGFGEHPSQMRPPQATMSAVWIKVGVSVAVMSAVVSTPPFDRTLHCAGTRYREDVLQWLGGIVSPVRPETMIT